MSDQGINQPKRVGLVLNNLIRDYIRRLKEVYEKYRGSQVTVPIDPYHLEEAFPLQNEEFDNVYSWLYYGVALEVFGGASQTQTNLLPRLATFQTKIEDELIMLSRETSRSKLATLSFLGKNQFDLSKLFFVESYEEYWEYVDVLITDNPEILKVKPEGKIAVVLKNDYNTEFHGEQYTIDTPNDIFALPIFALKPVKEEELIHVTGQMMEDEDVMELEDAPEIVVENSHVIKLVDPNEKIDLTELRVDTPETNITNQNI